MDSGYSSEARYTMTTSERNQIKSKIRSQTTPLASKQSPAAEVAPGATSSDWIFISEISARIGFVGIIIGGIAAASPYFKYSAGTGFLIVLLTIIIAFASISLIMVVLDMAKEVKAIKNRLSKQ